VKCSESSSLAARTASGAVKLGSGSAYDVFVAHNSLDKDIARSLAGALVQNGIRPWFDENEIPPGQWFQDHIQRGIRSSRSVAILIGRSGIGRWQHAELRATLSKCVEEGISVIPVLLPGVTLIPDELSVLRELNFVVFNSWPDDAGLEKLIWGISGIRNPSA
jgi:hypothetical protein